MDISVAAVSKCKYYEYKAFAAKSEDHLRTVMLSNALKWKIYRWGDTIWACRADGEYVGPSYPC